jgi:hypothetical protein
MSQIDFGNAFSKADEPASSASNAEAATLLDGHSAKNSAAPKVSRSRLGRDGWTNILFTIVAVGGGLFLAFYFFDGADFRRGEYSARPPSREGTVPPARNAAPESTASDAKTQRRNSGDPFSRINELLSVNPPSLRLGRTALGEVIPPGSIPPPNAPVFRLTGPSTLLSGLRLSLPYGDSLTQALNRGALERAR